MDKQCPQCHRSFTPPNRTQICCSRKCHIDRRNPNFALKLNDEGQTCRTCNRCLREQPVTEFYTRAGGKVMGNCIDCFNERMREYRQTDQGMKHFHQATRKTGRRYTSVRIAAKRRGLDFNLSKQDYEKVVTNPCHYCDGELPEVGSGLDRIDSSLGYVPGNVWPCCTRCNRMKNNLSLADFEKHVLLLASRIPFVNSVNP